MPELFLLRPFPSRLQRGRILRKGAHGLPVSSGHRRKRRGKPYGFAFECLGLIRDVYIQGGRAEGKEIT